jgi:hypothetical protein
VEKFQDHDLTHVVFGCDTSIHGERAFKPWILFGKTINLQEIKDYAADDGVQRLNNEGEALLGGRFITLMLFRYLHWRILTRLLSLQLYCLMGEVLAPLWSMLIRLGLPLDPIALFSKA